MAHGALRPVLLGAALWLAAPAPVYAAPLPDCPFNNAFDVGLSDCAVTLVSPGLVNIYMDKKCQTPECLRYAAALGAANPNECNYNGLRLYADILTPLRNHCAELERAKTTEPPASTPSTPSSPTPEPPSTTTATTLRPTETPTATTASPASSSPSTASSSGESVDQASSAPSPTTSPVDEADADASNGSLSEVPMTTTKPPRIAPATPSPVLVGSEGSPTGNATQWVLGALAVVGFVVVVALIVYRRRQRASMRPKSPSAYAANRSPYSTDDTRTNCSQATTVGIATDRGGDLLSGDLRNQIDKTINADATLAAWRLHGTRFTEKRFLGRGSHAFVHLVELPDGTCLAAKRLVAGQMSLTNVEQLIHEAHTASTLQHQSIVAFVGVAWASAFDFQLLFEFMAGGDLRTYLDTHKPSTATHHADIQALDDAPPQDQPQNHSLSSTWSPIKLHMALSVAEGLAYAHSFNPPLVHRDLKSRNILLTNDLHAKISDFGVARFLSENDTMTTGIGTNRWLAPEVLAGGGTYTEKCDIYSFGVVLTELDTHEVPLASEMEMDAETGKRRTELSLMRGIARGELRPRLSTSCPVGLRELATRCLSLDAADRPNALELSYCLRSIVSGRLCD